MKALAVQKKSIILPDLPQSQGANLNGKSFIRPNYQIRQQALALPQLRLRPSAIMLALSDPHSSVRLEAARQLAKTWEDLFASKGLQAVVERIVQYLDSPILFFSDKDPRIQAGLSYKPTKAKINVQLGVLMAMQVIFRKYTSELRLPLARYLYDSNIFDALVEGRNDHNFAKTLVESNFNFADIKMTTSLPLNNLMKFIKFAIVIGSLEREYLKDKYFPELTYKLSDLRTCSNIASGILQTIKPIFKAIVQALGPTQEAALIEDELKLVVGCHVLDV